MPKLRLPHRRKRKHRIPKESPPMVMHVTLKPQTLEQALAEFAAGEDRRPNA